LADADVLRLSTVLFFEVCIALKLCHVFDSAVIGKTWLAQAVNVQSTAREHFKTADGAVY